MKGIVFTEFMDMVETRWGIDTVDDLIDEVDPASEGAYTSVDTYDYHELVAYIDTLHAKTGIEPTTLIQEFGRFLAASFVTKFPDFFNDVHSTIEILKRVDDHIHVEVRKLYPDAELPKFSYQETDDGVFHLYYESSRHLADLAHGLIEGCSSYFEESLDIEREGHTENGVAFETFRITVQ